MDDDWPLSHLCSVTIQKTYDEIKRLKETDPEKAEKLEIWLELCLDLDCDYDHENDTFFLDPK